MSLEEIQVCDIENRIDMDNCEPLINRCEKDVAIMWNNLTYYGKSLFGRNSTVILSQLKGQINFGALTAVMGPSGAGKTTLLRCINGLNKWGLSDESEIYVRNDRQIYPCFVVQQIEDHLFSSLTVNESIMYASLLKNKGHSTISDSDGDPNQSREPNAVYKANIENLITELMLSNCANNLISQCSGGEKKRTVIAMELTSLIKPNIICIDESTSGLDSYAAEKLIVCLQSIAHKHELAVVTSIHQPNSDILMMFDELYVLAKGGRCVYSGAPHQLRQHLLECHIQCFDYQSPIEVLLKISSEDTTKSPETDTSLADTIESVNRLIDKTSVTLSSINANQLENYKRFDGVFVDFNRRVNLRDMWYLLNRAVTCTWLRGWKFIAYIFGFCIVIGVIHPLLYTRNLGTDAGCLANDTLRQSLTHWSLFDCSRYTEKLPFINVKFFSFSQIALMYIFLCATLFTFSLEIKVFLNEHRNLWYSTGSYFFIKTIVDIPYILATAYIYSWIGYCITSQPGMTHWYNGFYHLSDRFSLLIMVIMLESLAIQSTSMFYGVVFAQNFSLACVMATVTEIINIFFCGFYAAILDFPTFLRALTNLSQLKLSNNNILILIYGRERCVGNRASVLESYDLHDDQFWPNVWMLFANIVLWRSLTLVCLLIIANIHWITSFKIIRFTNKYIPLN